jgi:hypothetical protein
MPASPPDLHDGAAPSLEFIRSTIARSASFTAVPGIGGALMGAVGLSAAIASRTHAVPEEAC